MKRKFRYIGDFKYTAQFQKQSRTTDGAGGWTNSWVTDETARCEITPISGSQGLEMSQVVGYTVYKIIVRHNSNFESIMDNDYRILVSSGVYAGTYNVHSSLLIDGDVSYYEIMAYKK